MQERVRNFLKAAYVAWHPKYLVIGGSTDLIPARKVAFQTQSGHYVNTDRYYACLEGTWNEDGDAFFAEQEDSADMTAELVVSRLPADTWSQLRGMIERSSIAFGLPPYMAQGTGNGGSVALTGIRMFNSMGAVSDGKYYADILSGILAGGAYSKDMTITSYFPHDDTTNSTTDTLEKRFEKFLGKLTPMPGMWVHFGHGGSGDIAVDRTADGAPWVMVGNPVLDTASIFNRFRRMSHVRIVGCETGSQDLNSAGRHFLSKSYGGALSYLGTWEYSYPVIESRLLQEEFRNMADSTIFTWGDVYARASRDVLLSSGSWDLSKWVVFSRNYLGDPLMPVRFKNLGAGDSLSVSVAPSIVRGANRNVTVTVANSGSQPVEGVRIGLVSQAIEVLDSTEGFAVNADTRIRDLAFAQGVTNRKGQVVLDFETWFDDSISITATHPDYLAARGNLSVANPGDTLGPSIYTRIFDDFPGYGGKSFWGDGVYQAGESLQVVMKFANETGYTIRDSVMYDNILIDSVPGVQLTGRRAVTALSDTAAAGAYHYFRWKFFVRRCPEGATNMTARVPYTYRNYTAGDTARKDTAIIPFSVVGPKVLPVITYLIDTTDTTVSYPHDGLNVRMNILLANKYPVFAHTVNCSLFDVNSSFVTITRAKIDSLSVYPDSSLATDEITYSIGGGYDEDTNGLLTAKLKIRALNFDPETLLIDLNPIRDMELNIDRLATTVDHKGGVTIAWDPQRYSSKGRRSDFLGYVVIRSEAGDTNALAHLLTPWPVVATNSYHDENLPATAGKSYTYRVAAVDSSFNCSAEDTVTVAHAPPLKAGFPIYIGGVNLRAPSTADYDRDGNAEIYTVDNGELGRAIGFRADGQEAVVSGVNDGVVDLRSVGVTAHADLDGDGYDEAILCGDDTLYVRNFKDASSAANWKAGLSGYENKHGVSGWFRKPVIADLNMDGNLEIIVYGMDNAWDHPRGANGAACLQIFSNTGTLQYRRVFRDASYAPAIAVGNFNKATPELEIAIAAMKYDTATCAEGGSDTTADRAQYQNWKYYLHMYDATLDVINMTYVCNVAGRRDTVAYLWDQGQAVSSGLAVGQLDNQAGNLEAVLCIAGHAWSRGSIGDTLAVYRIDTANGYVDTNRIASYPVTFSSWSIFGSNPVLSDVDRDGIDDIVFATDDSVYCLKMQNDTLTPILKFGFGTVPGWRLLMNTFTPQPLVADIDKDGKREIIINHQGDGKIWAFKIDTTATGQWTASVAPRFPLKTRGRVMESCAISDLEGDGVLDLVAIDEGGFAYAWVLDTGSILSQPWPVQYGSNWNTANPAYKDQGPVGFLYENWGSTRKPPFKWVAYDSGNSTDTIPLYPAFSFANNLFYTDKANDYSAQFKGPATANWRNYTVEGKIKFVNSSAEFGIDFYSSWPVPAKKYTILRQSDGLAYLFFVNGNTFTLLDTLDADSTLNDSLDETGVWYHYQITISQIGESNQIKAWFWKAGSKKPTTPGIAATDVQLSSGSVGVSTHAGTGSRYWGPIMVRSNDPAKGAYLAHEDLTADTIVDIKPYTPRNWHPDYRTKQFRMGTDTTGFVLDTAGDSTALVYRHRDGVEYPVICRVAPRSNLEWKNYEVSATVIKPAGLTYDSIGVGLVFYAKSADEYYCLKDRGVGETPGFVIVHHNSTRDSVMGTVGTIEFKGDTDVVNMAVLVEGIAQENAQGKVIEDSIVRIKAQVWLSGEPISEWESVELVFEDKTTQRHTAGYGGVVIDHSPLGFPTATNPIRIKKALVKRTLE